MKKILFMFIAVSLLMVSCEKEKEDTLTSLAGSKWENTITITDGNVYTFKLQLAFVDDKKFTLSTEMTASHLSNIDKTIVPGTYTYDNKDKTGIITITAEKETETLSFVVNEKELTAKDMELLVGKQDIVFKRI
ncbi:MAG: hypothetical protein Q4G63_01385 [Bacteroidia bacterium]|nr:hypothetical protein [Bacteroidia bacterium]